jgi:cyclophilin family peptidyl-prolyl cis-trans isomerase/HEAT repeat protein
MSWKRWSSLFVVALVLALARCASSTGAAPRGPAARRADATPSAPKFASPAEAQVALLALEDRRAYEEATLTAAARDGSAATRARSAMAIGRVGEERGETLLRELLADKAPEVRAAAAWGYEVMGDPALTADLIPLLSDADSSVAMAAAKAIGFLGRGDGQDALLSAIPAAPSPQPRAAMLAALWKQPNAAVQAAALAYATDPDPRVRAAAIYALARKPLEGSLPALTAALNDPDADIAAVCARALGLLEKRESLGPLGATLESGRTPLVINALVAMESVLEKNPGASIPNGQKDRILALAGDANGNVAVPALVLLRQFAGADRDIFRRLWSIATTGEGRRRQVALLSVVALLKGKAGAALKAAAESPDPALRAAAAESLAFLPNADARPWRDRFAEDKSPLVKLGVLGSLKTIEAVQQNRDIVNSALTDPGPGVRAAAVEALGLTGEPSVLPLLQEAANKAQADAGPEVAASVIGVCEKLRADPGARRIVESLYRQARPLVARLARRSLVLVFRADPAAFPAPEYKTGRSLADYAEILAEAKKPWQARVETSRGEFTIHLAGDAAPLAVLNFVRLAQQKFFEGVPVHRVVPNFVLQDGDPTGTGDGGPGYQIRDEINPLEYGRGAVGMALSGPDTGGSQWFVTHSPQPHLNGIYTVFGQVTAGQDVVERIEQWDRITRITVSAGS